MFNAQTENPVRGDWATPVKDDLKELGLNVSFEQIMNVEKQLFKKIVKERVKQKSF